MQATGILFLNFCGEFAHCGDQKKLSAKKPNPKGTSLKKKN